MKKFTLLTAVLFFAILSNAQITKGSTMIGGSLGFSSQDSKQQDQSQTSKQKQSGGSISLQAGTAFATNKMVGVFLSYGHSKNKFESPYSNSEVEGHGYGGGVFYRQYFPLSTKWYLFGNMSLGYFSSKYESKQDGKLDSDQKLSSIELGITPGISFAAGRRLHIEAAFANLLSLEYNKIKGKDYITSTGVAYSTTKTTSFSGNANLSGFNNITFGLRWFIPGKTK